MVSTPLIQEFQHICDVCTPMRALFVTGAISTNRYLPCWYYYNHCYYSLLHNQPCALWKQCKDNRCQLAFRYIDVTQSNEYITYFDSAFEFKEWYIKQLYTT